MNLIRLEYMRLSLEEEGGGADEEGSDSWGHNDMDTFDDMMSQGHAMTSGTTGSLESPF